VGIGVAALEGHLAAAAQTVQSPHDFPSLRAPLYDAQTVLLELGAAEIAGTHHSTTMYSPRPRFRSDPEHIPTDFVDSGRFLREGLDALGERSGTS